MIESEILSLNFFVPIKTVSELNLRQHWTKRHKRASQQKKGVALVLSQVDSEIALQLKKQALNGNLIVELIRISPRKLDDDNLQASLKAVRDEITKFIFPEKSYGRGDEMIKFEYKQKKGKAKEYAVEFSFLA